MKQEIKPANGRLGVLVVGVGGAVSTTMITGTLAARKGLTKAIGSITQMATMRMQDGNEKLIKDIVPLVDLNDIVFGGWDIFPDNTYDAALYAEVLKEALKTLFVGDESAARPAGSMEVERLYWWKHNTKLPEVSPKAVFDSVKIQPKVDIPSKFEDYEITLETPEGCVEPEIF